MVIATKQYEESTLYTTDTDVWILELAFIPALISSYGITSTTFYWKQLLQSGQAETAHFY
jgi:hypothetical protein